MAHQVSTSCWIFTSSLTTSVSHFFSHLQLILLPLDCRMTSETPEYEIRLMKKEEIPQVLDLWRETNLSEGTYSIDTWYEYDPEGFYVAVTTDGKLLSISLIKILIRNPNETWTYYVHFNTHYCSLFCNIYILEILCEKVMYIFKLRSWFFRHFVQKTTLY